MKLPTVGQPQHVAAERDLDRDAVKLAHTTRLSRFARRERLAHHGELMYTPCSGRKKSGVNAFLTLPSGLRENVWGSYYHRMPCSSKTRPSSRSVGCANCLSPTKGASPGHRLENAH
jgi:hypothetical protein